jgi:hypothetical protein
LFSRWSNVLQRANEKSIILSFSQGLEAAAAAVVVVEDTVRVAVEDTEEDVAVEDMARVAAVARGRLGVVHRKESLEVKTTPMVPIGRKRMGQCRCGNLALSDCDSILDISTIPTLAGIYIYIYIYIYSQRKRNGH